MKVFKFAQKSSEWWQIRRGLPTASAFNRIIQPVTGRPSEGQNAYIVELIDSIVNHDYSFEPSNGYVSPAMEHGIDLEPAARSWYELEHNCDIEQVGFCLSDCGRFGTSPDGLVSTDGSVEIKCPQRKTHIRYLTKRALPSEYKAQVHGILLATGRAWCDFVSYSPVEELPNLVIRVVPDKFTAELKNALDHFLVNYEFELRKLGLSKPVISNHGLEV